MIKIFKRRKKKNRSTLSGGACAGGGRFLNDKGHALPLLLVVKCQAAYISIWVRLLALLDFVEDLSGVVAAKHWQLPQSPIPPIIVSWHLAIFSANTPKLPYKTNLSHPIVQNS